MGNREQTGWRRKEIRERTKFLSSQEEGEETHSVLNLYEKERQMPLFCERSQSLLNYGVEVAFSI